MKYIGTKQASNDVRVYDFLIGKEELEILVAICHIANKNTPDTTQNQIYKARLLQITKSLGKVFLSLKEKKLSKKQSLVSQIEKSL